MAKANDVVGFVSLPAAAAAFGITRRGVGLRVEREHIRTFQLGWCLYIREQDFERLRLNPPKIGRPRQQVCKRGHSLDDVYVRKSGDRNCRQCREIHRLRFRRQRLTTSRPIATETTTTASAT